MDLNWIPLATATNNSFLTIAKALSVGPHKASVTQVTRSLVGGLLLVLSGFTSQREPNSYPLWLCHTVVIRLGRLSLQMLQLWSLILQMVSWFLL